MKKQLLGWGIGIPFGLLIASGGYHLLTQNATPANPTSVKITYIGTELEKQEAQDVAEMAEMASSNTGSESSQLAQESLVDLQKDAKQERLSILRKRFALKGTITKGDTFIESNQPILALSEYLKALKESPNDHEIVKKIALTYFELKKFESSVFNYEKVLSLLSADQRQKYLLAMIYTLDFGNTNNIKSVVTKINNLSIPNEEKFYYINTISCGINFHECKRVFEEYAGKHPNPSFQGLKDISQALSTFKNFQTEELYYKDTLILGTFFQNKLYPISNRLGESLLLSKPNYQPVLLILGKGYYELGNALKSKGYLENYYNFNPNDTTISFLLGNINYKLGDYITSNLYYNASLKNGFSGREDLQRKLAYNYYLLGDKRGMLNVFGYLVDEPDATMDDLSLAIYWAIRENRTTNAIERSKKGIKKFNKNTGHEIFYGYLGWVYREQNNISLAETYINHGLKINPRNPLLLLNKGYLEAQKQNYIIALVSFKRTVFLNGDGEFGELASMEVKEMEKMVKSNSGSTNTGTGK